MPRNLRDWIAVLWPAFLAACLLEIVVFASFDPHDLRTSGGADPGIQSVYSLAFFSFWIIASLASLGTWTLARRQ